MNCQEIRSELPAAPLGLVDDRRARIEDHIAGCPDCAARAAALERAYDDLAAPLPPRERDTEALWSKIDAAVDGLPFDEDEPASRPEIHIALSCAYCHDSLSRVEARYCASCLTPHHGDCFREHGRCAALACEEVQTVRPSIESGPILERRRSRLGAAIKAAAGLSLVGAISAAAYVGSTQLRATQEAFRDELVAQRQALTKVMKEREAPPAPAVKAVEKGKNILGQLRPGDYCTRRGESGEIVWGEEKAPPFPEGPMSVAEALDWLYKEHDQLLFAPPEIGDRPFRISVKEAHDWALLRDICRQHDIRPQFVEGLPFGILRVANKVSADRDQGLREVLRAAGAAAGRQVVFFGVENGASPARFQKVGWHEVFSTFAKTRGLAFQQKGQVILASGLPLKWGGRLDMAPRVAFAEAAARDPGFLDSQLQKTKVAARHLDFEGRRDLAAWVALINAATAGRKFCKPVEIRGPAPEGALRLTTGRYDYRDALIALAQLTGLDLRDAGDRLVFERRPVHEGTVFRAYGAPSDVWMLALAEAVGETNVVFDEARPRLALDLRGVSARDALEASALSCGLTVEKRGSILQVFEKTPGHAKVGDCGSGGLMKGVSIVKKDTIYMLDCRLQGVLIVPGSPGVSKAFISGECYEVGDKISLLRGAPPLTLEAIDAGGVVVSNPQPSEPKDARQRLSLP